jgi:methionyl-tRNA formyltransferase
VTRGSELLVAVLAGGVEGLPEPVAQEGEPIYAHKIDPAELEIDWARPSEEILRLVRLDRAHTSVDGRRLRVLRASAVAPNPPVRGLPPGTLSSAEVITGDGVVRLEEVQPEGGRPMSARDWLRGSHLPEPVRLGAHDG